MTPEDLARTMSRVLRGSTSFANMTRYIKNMARIYPNEIIPALAEIIKTGFQSTLDAKRRRCIKICRWVMLFGNTHLGGRGRELLRELVRNHMPGQQ